MQKLEGSAPAAIDEGPACGCEASADEDQLLNTAAFVTLPTTIEDPEVTLGTVSETETATQDPKKELEERSEQAQGKVRSLFQRLKDAASSVFGKESPIGEAVQEVCCWAEEVACRAVDWWVNNSSHLEEEPKTENPVQDLIADMLRQTSEDGFEAVEKSEKRAEKEKEADDHSPMREMLEHQRRVEREKIDDPFFIEAFEPLAPEGPSPIGGSSTELVMEGGNLVEVTYLEDAEGHRVMTGTRVLFSAPLEATKPELVS